MNRPVANIHECWITVHVQCIYSHWCVLKGETIHSVLCMYSCIQYGYTHIHTELPSHTLYTHVDVSILSIIVPVHYLYSVLPVNWLLLWNPLMWVELTGFISGQTQVKVCLCELDCTSYINILFFFFCCPPLRSDLLMVLSECYGSVQGISLIWV